MVHDSLALSKRPRQDPLLQTDYDSICAAMMETARGRWFLGEYARRNRNADTQLVLAAIDRIERAIRGEAPAPVQDLIRTQLMAMAEIIGRTRADRAALAAADEIADDAGARVQKVVAALRDLDDQLAIMLGAWSAATVQIPPPQAALPDQPRTAALALVEPSAPVEPAARRLPEAFAPEPEPDADFEPLFPDWLLADAAEQQADATSEPQAAALPAAVLDLNVEIDRAPPPQPAQDAVTVAQPPVPAMEQPLLSAAFTEQLRAAFTRAVEKPAPAGPAMLAPAPAAVSPARPDMPRPAPGDPLAPLMALNDEERIALFS